MNNLNSIQTTIAELKDIVQRNQGINHETAHLVRQMELIVADIEQKTYQPGVIVVISPVVQAAPVV